MVIQMKTIELSRWEPSPEDPHVEVCAGQRPALEVFEELKYRLESIGYLPGEYFLMDRAWENGREIPKDANIFCTADYGGNGGSCLDVYLTWHENSQPVTMRFIAGKDPGEDGVDLDRMFLVSSAITKAFHGERGVYSGFLYSDEQSETEPESMILHLTPAEQRTVIQALVEQRERQGQTVSQTEQLLRRMTRSITAYMDTVDQRPLHLSDYDRAVLAIRDGERNAFRSLCSRLPDQADGLLIEAAGRPGRAGGNMVQTLLSNAAQFSPEAYLAACKRAVETGDSRRVQLLVDEADDHLTSPSPALAGEVMLYAYSNGHQYICRDLAGRCSPEQIAAAPPALLRQTAENLDFQTALILVDKGIQPGNYAADILHALTSQHMEWVAERLLEHGMPVEADNYAALYVCLNNRAAGAAKLLLDRGFDLAQYQIWAEDRLKSEGYESALEELSQHWAELQNSTGPSMGGMSM